MYVFIEAMVTSVRPGKVGSLLKYIYTIEKQPPTTQSEHGHSSCQRMRKTTPEYVILVLSLNYIFLKLKIVRKLNIVAILTGKLAGIGALVVSTSYHHITFQIITQDQTYLYNFIYEMHRNSLLAFALSEINELFNGTIFV